jgi:Proteasome subunit
VADGRSIETHTFEQRNKEMKLFDMSDLCVAMAVGDTISDIAGWFDEHKLNFHRFNVKDTTAVRDTLGDALAYRQDIGKRDPCDGILFAGYDEGSSHPRLLVISKDNWALPLRSPNNHYMAEGEGKYKAREVLEKDYLPNQDLSKVNEVALKALFNAYGVKVTYQGRELEVVGGQPQLWNIYPDKPVKKFEQEEINLIRSRL